MRGQAKLGGQVGSQGRPWGPEETGKNRWRGPPRPPEPWAARDGRPTDRRIGRAVHADAGGHGPPYEKSRRSGSARRLSSLVPKLCLGTVNYVSKLSLDSTFHSQVQPGNEDKERDPVFIRLRSEILAPNSCRAIGDQPCRVRFTHHFLARTTRPAANFASWRLCERFTPRRQGAKNGA
jgi:hypothetical protein